VKLPAESCKGAGFEADSGCGFIQAVSPAEANDIYGAASFSGWNGDSSPHGIAITVSTPKFDELRSLWRANGVTCVSSRTGTLFVPPEQCGDVIPEFEQAA
jgi:hypothetical protein